MSPGLNLVMPIDWWHSEFVSEHRLFLSRGVLWGMREYSEYMVGHRISNQAAEGDGMLLLEDARPPEEFVQEVGGS